VAPERQDARTGTGRQANTKTNDQGKPTTRRRSGPGSRLRRDELLRAARFGVMTDRHYSRQTPYECPCPDCARWRRRRRGVAA
jgi:hypothetical protein